jgi:predicted neuraminidase
MKTLISIVAAGGFIASGCATSQNHSPDLASTGGMQGPVLKSEFIYEEAPFPSCHASTIAETPDGLAAAWFGGTDEGEKDVGVWFARHDAQQWSTPVEVANGIQADGTRHPCWNPVLHQADDGPLVLFYKVGPSPSQWWGMRITSTDGGGTWSTPERLPEGQLGPVRSKPVSWENGALLCGSSSEHDGWRVHMELTPDLGQTWKRTGSLNDPAEFGAIQPTILKWGDGRVQILCRSRQGRLTES